MHGRIPLILIAVGSLAFLAALAYVVVTLLSLNRSPVISTDYHAKLRELAIASQGADPDAPNAYPILLAAAERLGKIEEEALAEAERRLNAEGVDTSAAHAYVDFTDIRGEASYYDDETSARWTLLATRIAAERAPAGGIDADLDAIAAAPLSLSPLPEGNPPLADTMYIEAYGAARKLARYAAGRFDLAVDAGDEAEMLRRVDHLLALARAASFQPLLISRLVRVAIGALAEGRIRDAVLRGNLSAEALAAFADRLDRMFDPEVAAAAIEGERLFMADLVQRTFTDDGRGSGRPIPSALKSLNVLPDSGPDLRRIPTVAAALSASRRETNELLDRWKDASVRLARNPGDAQAAADLEAALDEAAQPRHVFLDLGIWSRMASGTDPLIRSRAGLIRLLVAIERHRVDHTRPPADLAGLVPAYLPEIPQDPFAPNRRFRYRAFDAPDEHARTYLLYAVGRDGVDNGGRLLTGDEGDQSLTPFLASGVGDGYDAIANPPPPERTTPP